jgi:hypothetical protein
MRSGRKGEQGFALVESISTIAFAALALTGGLTMTYVSFARLWLNRAAYETSICLSTPVSNSKCKTQLEQSTAQALPIGTLENVLLNRRHDSVETKVRWRLARGIRLAIEDHRPLPLIGPLKEVRR